MSTDAEPRMAEASEYDQETTELKTELKAKKEAARVADSKGMKNTPWRKRLDGVNPFSPNNYLRRGK